MKGWPVPAVSVPDPIAAAPLRVHGKFFFAGERKHYVKGVTYGPFAVGSHGAPFPEREMVGRDFALMRGAGINTVRVFTVPPVWLLDAAGQAGLKVMVGLPWSQHIAFLADAASRAQVREAVTAVGLRVVTSSDDSPRAVVMGYDPTLDYPRLAEAALAVRRGAIFIASNLDATLPTPRGPMPGMGSLAALVSTATGMSSTSASR